MSSPQSWLSSYAYVREFLGPNILKTAGDTDSVPMEYGPRIGNGIWRIEWSHDWWRHERMAELYDDVDAMMNSVLKLLDKSSSLLDQSFDALLKDTADTTTATKSTTAATKPATTVASQQTSDAATATSHSLCSYFCV